MSRSGEDAVAQPQNLQELVDRRLWELGERGKPLSTRMAAQRSHGKVSYETLRLLQSGKHSGSVNRDTAEGIAEALDVPLNRVLRLAGQRIPQGPFVLPKKADTLTPSERATVLSVVDAILDAARQDRSSSDVRAVAGSARRPGGTRAGAGQAAATARQARAGQRRSP
ncbi:MAG: hypothetical protein ACRC35_06545 [Angustibacter sp.]